MKLPTVGYQVIHPKHGRLAITHWREIKGRRVYFSGMIRLGDLDEVLPMVVDMIISPAPVKTSCRLTIDLSKELFDAISEACVKTNLTKAQYIRNALEVLNLLSDEAGSKIFVHNNGKTVELLIPGISKRK